MNQDLLRHTDHLHARVFRWLLLAVSIALAVVVGPFYGAVLWGVILAILFMPMQRRVLARLGPKRQSLAAAIVLLVILGIVVLPLIATGAALVQEVGHLAQSIQTRQIDPARGLEMLLRRLPSWLTRWLEGVGIADVGEWQRRAMAELVKASQAAAGVALSLGQNTLGWMVNFAATLYLAFFLLRDGGRLSRRIYEAIPLDASHKRTLFAKFTTVIRATVKGNFVVAAVQGALGGLAFWFLDIRGALLWAVLMALLSLLPAIGAALVWLPVALWLLAAGETLQGVGLMLWGTLVIGLVDNVLRPILVGKDTRMPDWVVLLTTLGGMALLGINGFVIGPMVAAMFIAAWEIYAPEGEGRGPEPAQALRTAATPEAGERLPH